MRDEYRLRREKEMNTQKSDKYWMEYNLRYVKTYRNILGHQFCSKILDVGCGTGHLVRACKKEGYDAEGIDIETCNFEKDHLPYKDETFNLVICNAVLEHLGDPTHKKPYTPRGLEMQMKMYGFHVVFLEPGLIGKSVIYWKLPSFLKWGIAEIVWGGTKSILCISQK